MYLFIDWWELNPSTGDYDYHSGEYHTLKNLSFAPQADLTGNSLPVNEYTLDIITTDGIPDQVDTIELYDDLDQLWAAWPLRHVQRIAANCWRVRAASWIEDLDTITLPAKMYTTETAADVALECFGGDPSYFTVDAALQAVPVSGFCPEQSARERLTWLVFIIGAYVCDTWRDDLLITAVDSTETIIPFERTFWRPTVDTAEWVTAVKVKTYAFTEGTPGTTDDYVEDANGTVYIVTESEATLTNPSAPGAARENVVRIEGLYLINNGNVSGILSHLSQWYFNRAAVGLDTINNAEYAPGNRVVVYADNNLLYSGYITSAGFMFGRQARATLKLTAAERREGAKLTINYLYESNVLARAEYYFPVSYGYRIKNPYIDRTMDDGHRRVFRPADEYTEGTMTQGGNAEDVDCEIALDLYEGILHIISVDSVTEDSGDITIGVIA